MFQAEYDFFGLLASTKCREKPGEGQHPQRDDLRSDDNKC
jgi:hypothetical protein